ncbi:MAG: ABC transporter permease [Bryobacteraceae bacterium]|nr:ABC transporter permease [Bryobacteraceae bacterium]
MSALLQRPNLEQLVRTQDPPPPVIVLPKKRRFGSGSPLLDVLRQTGANIWRNKLRSFLTMFGIAWGIASLVLMAALGDGFREGQRKNMSQIGDNIVMVFGGRTEKQAGGERAGRRIFLKESDVAAIRQFCPTVATVSSEVKNHDVTVRSAFNAGRFLTVGATPEYLKLRNLPLETGRIISGEDNLQGRRVAMLGSSVRKQLFEKRPKVLGETIFVNNYPYLVVGLLTEKNQNSSYDGWDNDKVVIPASALRRDAPPTREVGTQGRIYSLVYRPASTSEWETAQTEVRRTLGRIHGFDPDDKAALPMWDMVEGAKLFDKVFDSADIFLAAIALVTLSLGGIGVMNTMMMAVSERVNEIGLKKALGATRRRILADFFLEGLTLAILSGLAGLAVTLALAAAVNSLPMPAMWSGLPIHWKELALASLALGAVALLSALPPAWQAAQLTPVEALRHER